MKKIFTLAAVALTAICANAQETWSIIGADSLLRAEYVPNADATKASVVEFATENVAGTHVSGPVAGYVDGEVTPLEPKVDNTWQGLKRGVKLNAQGEYFVYVQGRGNPVNLEKIKWEAVETDGVPTGMYRPDWTDTYYNPDGTAGFPKNGTYITVSSKVNGKMTVGIWVNKGTRDVYVVKASDAKALAFGTDVKISGYLNGQNNEDGTAKYFEEVMTLAQAKQAFNDTCTVEDKKQTIAATDSYVVNSQFPYGANQASFVYFTWDSAAGETYYVFNKNTQIGFSGFEFTAGASGIADNVANIEKTVVGIYSLSAAKQNGYTKGINIVRYSDGSSIKVIR